MATMCLQVISAHRTILSLVGEALRPISLWVSRYDLEAHSHRVITSNYTTWSLDSLATVEFYSKFHSIDYLTLIFEKNVSTKVKLINTC